ncbi:MAG: hypothetical protein FOGNACKC_01976 [Anaerolineae bacterium]|nr:hypothetical protein [Anaerolineae bacterium]
MTTHLIKKITKDSGLLDSLDMVGNRSKKLSGAIAPKVFIIKFHQSIKVLGISLPKNVSRKMVFYKMLFGFLDQMCYTIFSL